MSDCIFCKIASGEIPGKFVYQDDAVMVIEDIHPQAPVHFLVIPKTHISEFLQADDSTLQIVFSTVKRIVKEKNIKNYRLVNNGAGAAMVDHLHVHVLGSVAQDRNL